MLVLRRHCEEREDQRDDEDVVHRKRLLDHIPNEVLIRRFQSLHLARHDERGTGPDRLRCAVLGGVQSEAEPVVLVGHVHEAAERDSACQPDDGPCHRLLHLDFMGFAVKDAKVEREERDYKADERDIRPDF